MFATASHSKSMLVHLPKRMLTILFWLLRSLQIDCKILSKHTVATLHAVRVPATCLVVCCRKTGSS